MSPREIDAVQGALAAEHAVIWGYGVVGAAAGEDLRPAVAAAEGVHRARRDATADLLRSAAAVPAVARPSYELPFPVATQAEALRLADRLEFGAAAAWRYVLGQTELAELRRTARDHLIDTAVQAMRWRQAAGLSPASVPFPGQ